MGNACERHVTNEKSDRRDVLRDLARDNDDCNDAKVDRH